MLSAPEAQYVGVSGGKAANLAKLRRNGFTVPDGFIITTAAHQAHLQDEHLSELKGRLLAASNTPERRSMLEAAKALREAILALPLSESLMADISSAVEAMQPATTFAVRSSAPFEDGSEQSWAGQFDTFLSVGDEGLESAVKSCWASQFGSRALSYAGEKLNDAIGRGFSVFVQAFVPGDVSGVAFSVDPRTDDSSKLIIEAVLGTGDSLVSGSENPLSIVMAKRDNIVLKRRLGDNKKDILTAGSLRKISKEIQEIESFLGYPVDVEWTMMDSKLWILQARPITGLSNMTNHLTKSDIPSIEGYELTFKVTGLGFLFTDMLIRGFGYLDPLFSSNKLAFRQYFPEEKMEYAAKEGYKWLSSPGGFESYRSEFSAFHDMARNRAEAILSESITTASFGELVGLLARYLEFYSKTDFQFTNVTYLYYEEDKIVRHSLDELAKFKERARLWINSAVIEEDGFFARLVGAVASQLGIEGDDIESYKISEVIEAFDGGRLDGAILDARREAFVIFKDAAGVNYVWGEPAQAYIDESAIVEERLAGDAIVGQVAHKTEETSVTGRVRLINVDYDDQEKMDREIETMEAGEVLVSEFTAPELMEACRKAKAIVTDLGGMLSHAAIVSRELGVPCVVGTRNASRAFANGDEISVNLVSGSVEKLSK